MTTFYLIRHAVHDHDENVITGRTPGVHLSPEGQQQAERLATRLEDESIDVLYSSPLERTLETASVLARRLSLSIEISAGIGEIDYGDWSGMTLDALAELPRWRQFNLYRSGTRIPNGESMLEAQVRAVDRLEQWRERHQNARVAVVSHGDIIKSVLAYFLGIPLDLFSRIEITQASVSVLELSEFGPRVLRVNDCVAVVGG